MTPPRTAAEHYLQKRQKDPIYAAAYERARRRVDAVDTVVRTLDSRRENLGLSKAEVARRAGLQPEAVRRLFASKTANPTLATLSAVADALELEIRPVPRDSPEKSVA